MKKYITILVTVLILALMVLPFYGFTVNGEVNFSYSLNGSITVTVGSEDNRESFDAKLKTYIDGCNMVSGDSDMLEVESVGEIDSGYSVRVKFRRIDKIRAQSLFELRNFQEYSAEGSSTREYIEKLNNGNISGTTAVSYDGMLGQIIIPRTSVLKVEPHNASGEKTSLETMFKDAASHKSLDIVTFKVLDVENVEKITVTVPGKVKFYGGQSVKMISENTFELRPISVRASVLKNKIVIDEDGVEKIEPSIEIKDVGTFVGYIVLDKGIAPVALGLLIAVGVIVVGLIAFAVIRIRHIGKRVIEKENLGGGESGQIV